MKVAYQKVVSVEICIKQLLEKVLVKQLYYLFVESFNGILFYYDKRCCEKGVKKSGGTGLFFQFVDIQHLPVLFIPGFMLLFLSSNPRNYSKLPSCPYVLCLYYYSYRLSHRHADYYYIVGTTYQTTQHSLYLLLPTGLVVPFSMGVDR